MTSSIPATSSNSTASPSSSILAQGIPPSSEDSAEQIAALQSLFSTDEARFISDSFASAHSFDPFQHGAPGVKVPSVLPPGLIQSLTAPGNTIAGAMRSSHGPSPHNQSAGQSSASSQQTPFAWDSRQFDPNWIHGQDGQHQQSPMRDERSRNNSWAPTSSGYPNAPGPWARPSQGGLSNASPFAGQMQSSPSAAHHSPHHHHHHHSASFSGHSSWPIQQQQQSQSQVKTGGPNTGGAYGQNRAWQMQQLEALRAERQRYLESTGGQEAESIDDERGSASGYSDGNQGGFAPSSSYPPHSMSQNFSQHVGTSMPGQPPDSSLSMLANSFPSSHNFPASSPPGRQSISTDANGDYVMSGMDGGHQRGLSMATTGNMSWDGHQTSNAWPAKPPADTSAKKPSSKNNRRASAATGTQDDSPPDDGSGSYKPWAQASSPSRPSPEYPLLKVDPTLVSPSTFAAKIGSSSSSSRDKKNFNAGCPVEKAFYKQDPAQERRHLQPHLVEMKQRRHERRTEKQRSQGEQKKTKTKRGSGNDNDSEGGDDDAEKDKAKKGPHVLLTEAEKKANHIASEQKRRANIRKGYELLCNSVPALRDALGGEADGGGGGYEVGGERIDGRAGPRSEAVVLGRCEYTRCGCLSTAESELTLSLILRH